jgi:DNA-binding transcriptional LysR family regulator
VAARPKLADVDLNLLVALDALLGERSVTRAAKRLGVGQPAMSGALGRLRTMLGDPLLVRTSQGMQLTARAAELREPLADALGRIEQTLSPPGAFDAARAERTFVICTTDYFELVLLPPLSERLRAEAPRLRIEIRDVGEKRIGHELAAGSVDLAIGPLRETAAGIYRQVLYDERLVCVVRADHPKVGAKLTVEEYAALGHVMVSPRGGTRGFVDRMLAERGLERRVLLTTPHFLVAPAVAARTDLVATVAERLARQLERQLGLRVLELPLEVAPARHVALWHDRMHRDPGHRWLRRVLGEIAA